jgi:hypothetical protein
MKKKIVLFRKKTNKTGNTPEDIFERTLLWDKGIILGNDEKDNEVHFVVENIHKRPQVESYERETIELVPCSKAKIGEIIIKMETAANEIIYKLEKSYLSEKRNDYTEELDEKYQSIREDVINTCKNIHEDLSEVELHNKLSAIAHKRKKMFEIKCDSVKKAEYKNHKIRQRIQNIKLQMNVTTKELTSIPKVLKMYLDEYTHR